MADVQRIGFSSKTESRLWFLSYTIKEAEFRLHIAFFYTSTIYISQKNDSRLDAYLLNFIYK